MRFTATLFQMTAHHEAAHCSPCPESAQNWPYLYSSSFAPLATHWFINTVRTRFSVLQTASSLLRLSTELLKVYTPNRQLRSSSDTSILCLPCVCACTHLVRDLFLVLHRPSGTVPLSKSDCQAHLHLLNHLSNLTSSSYPIDWVCVCVCVLCNGLCAPICRNST